MRILTVDPGKTTGWALWLDDHLDDAGEHPADEFPDVAHNILEHRRLELVVSERFVITAGTMRKSRGDENWSIEQIGILRFLCRRYAVPFELQGAGDAMGLATNERLKHLGWYRPGQGHANDALRHLVLALGRHEPARLGELGLV